MKRNILVTHAERVEFGTTAADERKRKARAMTKAQFIDWAKSKGWEEDKFGHLHRTVMTGAGMRAYRFKVSAISVRYEVQVHHPAGEYSPARNEWMRLRSGWLKDLRIDENGKLSGLKF